MYCFFLFFIQIQVALAQINKEEEHQPADISIIERQAHQRIMDATGDYSMDSFTVASENIDVHHYRCEWLIDPSVRFINGKVTVSFVVKSSADKIIFDLSSSLNVDSIIYHGNSIPFQRVLKDGLQIPLPGILSAGQKDSVSIYYNGIPDPGITGVIHQGNYRGNFALWTLSEPYGAKLWWPCKNGLSDKADSIDIIITTPDVYLPSSNGIVVNENIANGQLTTHFRHRYPIASYLVAVALSKYYIDKDSIQIGTRQMPVIMYVLAVATPNFHKPAIVVAKQCLQKFSDLFGLYPFYKEHYCQTQWLIGSGGMEHQTNSFLGSRGAALVSHELGHQWFGDKVTCGSWQDLWLNEGFATYTTNIFYEHFDTALLRLTLQNIINSVTSQPGGSVWVDDTTRFSRLFDGRLTYNKGSYVVHMLRWVLGDSVFFKGIRRYLDDAAVTYSFARTADLKKALETESGKNLETFFQKWIYGQGYPNYNAEWTQNNNNWIKVKLNQTTSHPSVSFYEMPVTLVAKSGSQESTFIVDHRYSGQEFWLNPGFAVDSILVDPKLWILSKNKTSAKINSVGTSNEIKIFPNPAPDVIKISLKNPTGKKLHIRLLNVLGQMIYQKEMQTQGRDELINIWMGQLPKGVYWLMINNEDNIKMLKKILH